MQLSQENNRMPVTFQITTGKMLGQGYFFLIVEHSVALSELLVLLIK